MKERVNLETAMRVFKNERKLAENETIFVNPQGTKFTLPLYGKYNPGMTIEFSTTFIRTFKEDGYQVDTQYLCPYEYVKCEQLTDGMNMDWDADVKVLFGRFRMSKTGKPVFTITDPIEAHDVLVRADWGGCFSDTRGQHREYEGAQAATYFRRASSNGGGTGYDYYVLPVDFILNGPKREDITRILKKASEMMQEEERKYEQQHAAFLKKEAEKAAEIAEYKPKILTMVNEYLSIVKKTLPEAEVTTSESTRGIEYSINHASYVVYYKREDLERISNYTSRLRQHVKEREEYVEMFRELIEVANHFDVEFFRQTVHAGVICWERKNKLKGEPYDLYWKYVPQTHDGYDNFATMLQKHIQIVNEKEKKQRAFIAAERARLEKQAKEERARDKGCPSDFTYYHRETGATGHSVAIVLDENGIRRFNDSIQLNNPNHRYHYNDEETMIQEAEGQQTWNQILEGEVVIAFTKSCTAAPLVFNICWMPTLTDAQKETIGELVNQYAEYYGVTTIDLGKDACRPLKEVIPFCEAHVAGAEQNG